MFSFQSNINYSTILYIRFLTGTGVGLLHGACSLNMGKNDSLEKKQNGFHPPKEERNSMSSPYLNLDSGMAKVWLTGFAISIITSGVLYNLLRQSHLYSVLTGSGPSFWVSFLAAPLFFGAIVYATEVGLQFCCFRGASSANMNPTYNGNIHQSHKEGHGTYHTAPSYSWENSISLDSEYTNGSGSVKRRNVRKKVLSNMTEVATSRENTIVEAGGSGWATPTHNKTDPYNRARLDSNRSTRSNDVFFDCVSYDESDAIGFNVDEHYEDLEQQHRENEQIDDEEMKRSSYGKNKNDDTSTKTRNNIHSIAKYVDSRCVYADGSPAHVQSGLCPATVPRAYKELFGSQSQNKWDETQQWRSNRRLYKIHTVPHVFFPKIKAAYPHYIHGFTKKGYPVIYEKPGAMNLKEFFRNGGSIDDMIRHYTFFMEYLSNVLCNKPELRHLLDQRPEEESASHWGFTVAMDIKGISLSVLSGDVMRYLKQAGDINTAHYPVSITTAILLQSPFWLSGSFGMIKSILPSSTKAEILSASNQLQGLKEYIDEDQIPKEYGGSSPYPLGEHPYEIELQQLVDNIKDREDIDNDDDLVDELTDNHMILQSNAPSSHVPSHELEDLEMCTPLQEDFIDNTSDRDRKESSNEYVFCVISIMHGLWCGVQGSLETALPLWLLSPSILGGLGYEPRRTGFALFSASIVLMWLLRTKASYILARIPVDSPMRGYRIGVGSQAVLMGLIPFIAYIAKDDSMLVMTTTILISALIFIASMVGRSSSSILHFEATKSYVDKLSLRCDSTTGLGATLNRIVQFYRTGGFTYSLGTIGEIAGAFFISFIFAHSAQTSRSFPFDASFSFYTGSLLCSMLYMLSFSLYVDVSGEVTRRGKIEGSASRCELAREVFDVSLSDMASLFTEPTWSG